MIEIRHELTPRQRKADAALAFIETPAIVEAIVAAAVREAERCATKEGFVDISLRYQQAEPGSEAETLCRNALIAARSRISQAADAAATIHGDAIVSAAKVIVNLSADMTKILNEESINEKTRDEILEEIGAKP